MFSKIHRRIASLVVPSIVVLPNCRLESNCEFSTYTYPANNPSEDRWRVDQQQGWTAAAVFDGHGGWQVSEYASKYLMETVLKSLEGVDSNDNISIDERLVKSFDAIEDSIIKQVKASFNLGFGEVAKVGSCVLLALKQSNRLVVANCGDCRAILGSEISSSGRNNFVSTRINRDHNARVALEHLILEKNHPNEDNLVRCKNPHACYVKGRLQLTRSLGDLYLKSADFNGSPDSHRSSGRYIASPYTPPYVSHQPEMHHIQLDPSDRFVIIATDGLWDYLSDKEAVEIVAGCLAQKDSNKAAYLLVERALQIAAEESGISFKDLKLLPAGSARRRKHDDTTAVVMFF